MQLEQEVKDSLGGNGDTAAQCKLDNMNFAAHYSLMSLRVHG